MTEPILRIIFCQARFFALEKCDPIDFADYFDYYKIYVGETIAEKYGCACIVETAWGSEYAVQFVCSGDDGHSIAKCVLEEYSSNDAGVVDFDEFVESQGGGSDV